MITFVAPSIEPTDTPQFYALRLALWCLQNVPDHGSIATAALDDWQLEQAARGLNDALTGSVRIDDVSTPVNAYDRIESVRVFVWQRIVGRKAETARIQADHEQHAAQDLPSKGKPIKLSDVRPDPRPLTPIGVREDCF